MLREKCQRITLSEKCSVSANQLKLVVHSGRDPREENFPNPGVEIFSHGMNPAVPFIEITNHADTACSGCPNCEAESSRSVDLTGVCSQFFPHAAVSTFAEEMQILLTKGRAKVINISLRVMLFKIEIGPLDLISCSLFQIRFYSFEEAFAPSFCELQLSCVIVQNDHYVFC